MNQADISAALQQSGVNVFGLKVDSNAGATTVSGSVGSEADRATAQQAINRVASDAEVNLQVNPGFADVGGAGAKSVRSYTVKSGDNLRKIAQHFYGDEMKWHRIYDANKDKIKNPDMIGAGMDLTIPE